MAKNIKTLKCPQCGSVKKQTVKEDHYICNNCSAEYFLDNDDLHVHVKHSFDTSTGHTFHPTNKKKLLIMVAAAFGFFFLMLMINVLFDGRSSSSVSGGKQYRDRVANYMAYAAKPNGNPILMLKTERNYFARDNSKEELLLWFYDPITDKVLNEQPVVGNEWKEGYSLNPRTFIDGQIYLCPDKSSHLYRLDVAQHRLEDITDKTFGQLPELASGLATIDFVSKENGDGFKIMTNDGKEYYYYPLSGMLYKDYSEMSDAGEQLKTLQSGAKESVHYIFTEESSEYKEEIVQLIKYWFKENYGYPIQLPYTPEWENVRDWTNFPYGPTRYEKKLFTEPRVTRFVDLTPARLYFDAHILYQDSIDLIIKGQPNANPEGKPFIQKIDTQTGKVLWTYSPEEAKYDFMDEVYPYKNGLILNYYNWGAPGRVNQIVLLDDLGKVIKEFDRDDFFGKE